MEIELDAEMLKFFYEILIDLYRRSDDPITLGFSEGMLQVCSEKPFTGIYDFIPFPHRLHKATILLDSIIHFHPFADGNKRVALVATYFFLFWNGYDMIIPENADEFTILIADNKKNLNDILFWIHQHTIMSFGSILRQKICYVSTMLDEKFPALAELINSVTTPFFFTIYPFRYLRYKIDKKRYKKTHPAATESK